MLTINVNYQCPTNLKVDKKLKLSGNGTCDLRVFSPLLYHRATSHIKYLLSAPRNLHFQRKKFFFTPSGS